MRHRRLFLPAAVLFLVSCSPAAQPTASPVSTATVPTNAGVPTATVATAATASAVIKVTDHAVLGSIVTDAHGRSLYVFDRDTENVSNCADTCLANWPPLTVESGNVRGSADITAKVGAFTRSDGARQVTLNGLPLYYYTADRVPGDAKGSGVGGIWWTVKGDGAKAAPAASGGRATATPSYDYDY
jgi:predicted lipoprotein with Yx(FWY)xxD motif